MPGTMKERRRAGDPYGTGRISVRQRQLMRNIGRGLTAPATQPKGRISQQEMQRLMEEAMKQTGTGIRGMNSQRRIDMLKDPKFRK